MYERKIKSLVLLCAVIALCAVTSLALCSCKSTSSEVTVALQKKYSETFSVTHMGDRYNTSSTKLYVYPDSNSEIRFTAKITDDGKVTDDYIQCIAAHILDEKIYEELNKNQIECVAKTVMMGSADENDVDTDFNISEYYEKYPDNKNLVYLVLNEDNVGEDTAQNLLNGIRNVSEYIDNQVTVAVFVMDSSEFERCREEVKEVPELEIDSFDSKAESGFNYDGYTFNISESELSEDLSCE